MNIIVCIKQVPETAEVKINPETNTLIREGVKSVINPFDMYAIEEAVRLREQFGGNTTVITMGPPQAETALRDATFMGIDDAILISDRAFAGSDTWATSYILSCAIKKICGIEPTAAFDPHAASDHTFDLILCGKQASDGDTAQVGPGIAAHLNIPQVTFVKKIREIHGNTMHVERMMEEGYDVIETPLPALLTVVKEINEPRLPSIRGMMRAQNSRMTVWNQEDLALDPQEIGLCGSPTQVIKIFTPPQRRDVTMLEGEPKALARQLVELLKNEVS